MAPQNPPCTAPRKLHQTRTEIVRISLNLIIFSQVWDHVEPTMASVFSTGYKHCKDSGRYKHNSSICVFRSCLLCWHYFPNTYVMKHWNFVAKRLAFCSIHHEVGALVPLHTFVLQKQLPWLGLQPAENIIGTDILWHHCSSNTNRIPLC